MEGLRSIGESGGEVPGFVRPYASETFVMACSLWCAAACTYHLSCSYDANILEIACIASLLIGIAIAVLFYRSRKPAARYLLVSVLGISLGVFCGTIAGVQMHHSIEQVSRQQPSTYLFEVIEDAYAGDYTTSCLARATSESGGEAVVSVQLPEEEEAPHYGTRFVAQASLKAPVQPNEFLWGKGAVAVASLDSYRKIERSDAIGALARFREKAMDVFDGYGTQGEALLRAVLFADRSGLDDAGFYSRVKIVGLAHMVAVSGSHLVIVSSSIGLVLRALRMPTKATVVLQILFIIIYLVFTAMPISALRAACMTIIATCSVFFKRRSSALDALALCIIIIVASSPAAALSVSFMLSALSTIGIIVIGPLVRSWTEKLAPRVPILVHESLSLTLSASIMTLPLSAAYFSQVSLISPIANVLAAPWFALLCIGGFVAVIIALCLPPIQAFVAYAIICADAFCELVDAAAGLPFAAVPADLETGPALLLGSSALVFFWVLWPRPSPRAGLLGIVGSVCGLAFMLFTPSLFAADEIIMLDVGQGDAFLIRSRGSALLIDTGTHDGDLLQGLARHGVYRLDGVMVSHADDDHCGSLQALCGIVQVGKVFVAEPSMHCGCASCEALLDQARLLVGDAGIVPLAVSDRIAIGAFVLTVLWPDAFIDEGGNADSLTALLTTAGQVDAKGIRSLWQDSSASSGFSALFCGDLEHEQLASMIGEGVLTDIDILKVGHHGSKGALSERVAAKLSPEVALVSVGSSNRYGHPSSETIGILDRIGCKIFRTDEEGDVVCRIEPGKLRVSAMG